MGKTPFLYRNFRYNYSDEFRASIGYNKEVKYIRIYNNIYKISLWDISGQIRFRYLPKKYYQIADGFLLLFDLTNKETFEKISS